MSMQAGYLPLVGFYLMLISEILKIKTVLETLKYSDGGKIC
jgi:hypothetical protein